MSAIYEEHKDEDGFLYVSACLPRSVHNNHDSN